MYIDQTHRLLPRENKLSRLGYGALACLQPYDNWTPFQYTQKGHQVTDFIAPERRKMLFKPVMNPA